MPPSLPVDDDPETCRMLREALETTRLAHEREARLSRTKTAYLRTVGHELSAPLASLREALTHLREPAVPGLPPAAAGHTAALRAIEASADWIAELREAMLDLARRDLDGA